MLSWVYIKFTSFTGKLWVCCGIMHILNDKLVSVITHTTVKCNQIVMLMQIWREIFGMIQLVALFGLHAWRSTNILTVLCSVSENWKSIFKWVWSGTKNISYSVIFLQIILYLAKWPTLEIWRSTWFSFMLEKWL